MRNQEASEKADSIVESEYLNRFENDPISYGKFLLPVSGRAKNSQNDSSNKSPSVSETKSTPSTGKPLQVICPSSPKNFGGDAETELGQIMKGRKEARHNSLPNIKKDDSDFSVKDTKVAHLNTPDVA